LAAVFSYTFLLSICAQLSNLDRSFRSYFWLTRVFSKVTLRLCGVGLVVKGMENVHPGQVYVYVSNHSSMIDIPAIMAAVPNKASIVFKKELGRIPLFGWQLTTGPYIMIDRGNPEKAMKSIERGKEMMAKKGISVILFAEGTRSKTGEVQPFKRGAFYLASKVKYPVIPVAITGTEHVLPKGTLSLQGGTVTVNFGNAVDTAHLNTKQDEITVMNKVRDIIIEMKENA
jgi:1-acyl-sn-glycerol-3-phosphate acyltransferase